MILVIREKVTPKQLRDLLEVYERITGQAHDDPQEFFSAMVAEQRLVLSLRVKSVVAQGLPD